MSQSENLNLPYILPSQAQKHVTHNEAIRALDAVLHLAAISASIEDPPETPQGGDRYIVPDSATGAWAGKAKAVAAWQDGAWAFYVPQDGWIAYLLDENRMLAFTGGAWAAAAFDVAIPDIVGINATADATNRLAVAAPASLFTNEGAGHQIKVNKANAGDTASLLFQTGWSGRAEMGLAGSDAFRIKVSADGSSFRDAMVVDPGTGTVAFPHGVQGVRESLAANRTYHVDPAGSDGNDGLTAGTPFATLQKAVDVALALDSAGYDITIQLADGTYAGAEVPSALVGGGMLFIHGNETTPSSVVLTSGLALDSGACAKVAGLRFAITTDLIHGLSVGNGVTLGIGKVVFGAIGANADHIFCDAPCRIVLEADYAIDGGARRHMNIGVGCLSATDRIFTLTGTPAFTEFAAAAHGGAIVLSNPAVVGSATGSRYLAETNGVINTFGKGATFLPGSSAGTTLTGGIYA